MKVRLNVEGGVQRVAEGNNVGDRTEVAFGRETDEGAAMDDPVRLTADQLEDLINMLGELLRERD